jgi:uncharacterized protein (DUF4415 family)
MSPELSDGLMKKEYDFSRGKRGPVLPTVGKTRITIYLDDVVLESFKAESERTGKGYQTLINDALVKHIGNTEQPVTAGQVRRIVREELNQART